MDWAAIFAGSLLIAAPVVGSGWDNATVRYRSRSWAGSLVFCGGILLVLWGAL